jgi:hypothetical protein
MINDLDIVQWGYLLDPAFQLVNSAGKPLTNGYIEVYYHGTRNKYYCASDFDGTLHPFKIPLDSLGSNIVLADPGYSYDIYIYNAFGSLVMSRYNVTPGKGGEGSGGGGVPGSEMPEHWLGMYGSSIQIPGTEAGTTLPVPTGDSVDYEGDFIDHIEDNKYIYLKEGLYLVECVIRFEQSSSDLKNELGEVLVYTGRGNANEDRAWQEDLSGPDANGNRHCLKMSFIRLVQDGTHHGDSSVLYFAPGSPVNWSWAQIQNLSIVKLEAGGGAAYKYLPGDYITIDNRIISVTGLLPESASANFVTNDAFNETVNNIYGDINNVSSIIEGDINTATSVIEGQITNITGDIVDIHNDITYVSAAVQEATVSGITRHELTAVSSVLENDIQTVSAAIPELPQEEEVEFEELDVDSFATHDEVAGVSATIEGDILSVSTVIEGDIQTVSSVLEYVSGAVSGFTGDFVVYTGSDYDDFAQYSQQIIQDVNDGKVVALHVHHTENTDWVNRYGWPCYNEDVDGLAYKWVFGPYTHDNNKQCLVFTTYNHNIGNWYYEVKDTNADWNAVSGFGLILNKPDLSNFVSNGELEAVTSVIEGDIQTVSAAVDSVSAALPETEEVTFEELDVDSLVTDDDLSAVTAVIENTIETVSSTLDDKIDSVSASLPDTEEVTFEELDVDSFATHSEVSAVAGDISAVSTEIMNIVEGVSATIEGDIQSVSTTIEGDISSVSTVLQNNIEGVSATIINNIEGDLVTVSTVLEGDIQTVSAALDNVSASIPELPQEEEVEFEELDVDSLVSDSDLTAVTSVIENTIETVSGTLDDKIDAVSAAVPAAQVNADWNATSGKAEILNKPDLSVYATHDEVAGATSVIENTIEGDIVTVSTVLEGDIQTVSSALDSVSASIPDAQVQSDWTEADDTKKSYIQHKPVSKSLVAGDNIHLLETASSVIISSDNGPVTGMATEAELIAVSGTLDDKIDAVSAAVPAAQVNADWDAVSGKAEILNKPDTYGLVAGSNVTIAVSGDDLIISAVGGGSVTGAVTEAELAAVSGNLESDIQTVSAAIPAAQVNSDWNATSGVAEILNKPTETDVIAGEGITITETASGVIISSTGGGTGDVTEAELIAVSGRLETDIQTVSAAMPNPLTAGNGIDITNDTVSLNNPINVVAGTGLSATQSGDDLILAVTGGGGSDVTMADLVAVSGNLEGDIQIVSAAIQGGGTAYQAGDYISISGNTISVTGLDNSDIFWVTSDSIQKDVVDAYNAGKRLFFTSYGKSYPLAYVNIISTQYYFYFWGFYNPQQSTPNHIWAWKVFCWSTGTSTVDTSGSGMIDLRANWNETNSLNPSYIQNKPDLSVYETKAGNAAVSAILEADIQTVSAAIQGGGGSDVTMADLVAVSGNLEGDIQTVSAAIPDVSVYATESELQTVSAAIPPAQVQANWNETNTSSKAYIQNKPTIPTLSTLNTAGITDIQLVNALPASPVSSVLYLIPET